MWFVLVSVTRTWFPYAVLDKDEYDKLKHSNTQDDIPDLTINNVAKDKIKGKDGLLIVGSENDLDDNTSLENNSHIIKVNPGDAIVFYNYDWIDSYNRSDLNDLEIDGDIPPPTGPFINFRSIHTGLTTTKDEKWIVTNWFNVPDE